MQRYFINKNQINNNTVCITGDDVHHIKTVMRMKEKDQVIVCDEENSYLCEITFISNNCVDLQILSKIEGSSELKTNVTLAHGLVRREKMEEVVRRLVELGCFSYIPVDMKRSVVKFKEINTQRLNKIIKEASEQSQRNKLMNICEVISFKKLNEIIDSYDLVLFAHALYKDEVNFFTEIKDLKYKNVLVIVGPEGGFDDKEVETILKHKNVRKISLGKRILRTETAPLYIMSVLGFLGEQYEN